MRVFITGGTGYIGSATLRVLVEHGHDVVAAVRSEDAAAKVTAAGASAAIGDLADAAWLREHLADSDGAIHLAHLVGEPYAVFADTVLQAYAGTTKPFIATSGVWMWGDNTDIKETDPLLPPAIVADRPAIEQTILDGDNRSVIIHASVVYGNGGGLVGALVGSRTDEGAVHLIGDGTQHWATVHVDDLADLYVLALESDAAVGRYLAASGHNPTVRQIGEATGLPVEIGSVENTYERFGPEFGDALLLDEAGSGEKARSLGWEPHRPSPLDEAAAIA
ncbi:NAD-dependent epimerase/dehydratase family protein [Curtobacterium sp. USHLN213]|uniref:NAD-dependent epimerase/dehydratase family protein n=1 Tax=Curtobacterium sp. USHLN213 TaxID=3081255 RepID=UPI00301716C8